MPPGSEWRHLGGNGPLQSAKVIAQRGGLPTQEAKSLLLDCEALRPLGRSTADAQNETSSGTHASTIQAPQQINFTLNCIARHCVSAIGDSFICGRIPRRFGWIPYSIANSAATPLLAVKILQVRLRS